MTPSENNKIENNLFRQRVGSCININHPKHTGVLACDETGVVLTKGQKGKKRSISYHEKDGYWRVKNGNINKGVHRLIWEYMMNNKVNLVHSVDVIDHINGDHTANSRNCKMNKNNTSRIKGVTYCSDRDKWFTCINNNNKNDQ